MRYPFSPAVLDGLPEPIAEMIRGLEDRILEEICSRITIAGELNEVTVEAIRALRSVGLDLSEIEKAIDETVQIGEEEIDRLFDEVVERNQKFSTDLITKADVTMPLVLVGKDEIDAIRRQTKEEFANLTRSMGFLIRKGGRIVGALPAASAYHTILDNAEMDVLSGAISYRQAIEKATRELADSGLKKVYYEADGRSRYDQADVAARRAVLTGVNQVNQRFTEQTVERLGTDLVEVSAHQGARDTGAGPENHKAWQGKVYQWVKPGTVRNPKYPDFEKVTGYGTGPGLGGWNCRHRYFAYVEGVSERNYTDKELKGIDRPPFEFQGVKYTQYEATQEQRRIERTVRKLKRRETAYKAAGLKEEAQSAGIRIKRLRAQYKAFSDAFGLPTQEERMKVIYPD